MKADIIVISLNFRWSTLFVSNFVTAKVSLDLLQVDLTSFLASGASFLGREAAKRATKA